MRSPLTIVVASVGLAALVGIALPLQWGVLVPLLVVVVLALWGEGRVRALDRYVGGAGLGAALGRQTEPRRALLAILLVLSSSILVAACARVVAAILVAFPASVWALPVVVVTGGLLGRLRRPRVVTVGALVAALVVPLVGLAGNRFEARGPVARGWAHSGPILGIHPFQTTAVYIDGHGPFDIPINDYVEPDGRRGYGPEGFADALQLALETIAEVHFSDGPAQAYKAFAEAEVEAVRTPGVRERLSREPEFATQPRFVVRSGTHGPGSKVEFVCPGQRNGPRPREPDNVMSKMCPNKYASEASAGLGVTGRWAGYAEGRGNGRTTLATWLGWTRSDDAEGREVVVREQRIWTGAVLLLAFAVAIGAGGRWGRGLAAFSGAMTVWVVLGLVGSSLLWVPAADVGWIREPAPWVEPSVVAWVPVLAMMVGWIHLLRHGGRHGGDPTAGRNWLRIRFLPALVGTVWLAGALAAGAWGRPDWSGHVSQMPLQQLLTGLASALALQLDADVQAIEAVLASVWVAILLGVIIALGALVSQEFGAVWRASGERSTDATPSGERGGPGSVGLLWPALIIGPAAVLAAFQSATALIPTAIGMGIVLASVLPSLDREQPPRGFRWSHPFWVVLAAALMVEPMLQAPPPSLLVLLITMVGLAAVVASLVFLRAPLGGHARQPGSR